MTAGELMQQLQRFPASTNVCVEVTEEIAAEVFDNGEGVEYLDLDTILPECRSGNSVKLTLV